ncbi:Alpha/Beta hydrolase protein [Dactylonectria macrodidyma]|uniref:Carboxylic ester hydrolase n=1 Tax=Dactylonectria macrodidyma TaxID=307937 RepID=A0A9P9FLY6_9HYPO|nr:Alpha/Beta hydrolase protein [Dactylonectria macrodidyma]
MGNSISYNETPFELSLGDKGAIRGLQFEDKSRRYAGVPYALPPIGEYRWRKPRPLPASYTYSEADGGAYNATSFKTVCPQKAFHIGDAEGGSGTYSEDCLFVNIWTPVPQDHDGGKKWPVMLWLHGGWFQMGDPSQEPGMDPTEMISTGGLNAIVVAIGYRLNVFGFLSGHALLSESGGDSGGNFGLWDQRMAAVWVKDNISLFGGDPNNITLAGRSAGAYSVEAQMLYEFRKPGPKTSLFRRIFMDSNAIPAQPKSLADGTEQFGELCAHFKIEVSLSPERKLARLRQISALDLVKAIPHLKQHTFRPITDGIFIHTGMFEYLQSQEFADEFNARGYRILIGEVLNEETLYSAYNGPTEPTIEALQLQVSNYYAPEVTNRILQCYGLPKSENLEEWKTLFGQIISDGQVRAPSRALLKHLVANGVNIQDTWRYQIAYRLSFIDEKIAPMSFGVAHAMDKPFWNFSICHGPTPDEKRLMKEWIEILVAFVNHCEEYDFGTRKLDEMKVVTSQAKIEVEKDERWDEILRIGKVFAGDDQSSS